MRGNAWYCCSRSLTTKWSLKRSVWGELWRLKSKSPLSNYKPSKQSVVKFICSYSSLHWINSSKLSVYFKGTFLEGFSGVGSVFFIYEGGFRGKLVQGNVSVRVFRDRGSLIDLYVHILSQYFKTLKIIIKFADNSPTNRLTPGKLIPIFERFSSPRKFHPVG